MTLGFPEEFERILDSLGKKSPLQRKRINNYLVKQNRDFFNDVAVLIKKYLQYLESQKIPLESAITSYVEMCNDMMCCQRYFMRTGRYPVEEATEFIGSLYKNEVEMKSYMIGLAISQFLWRNHYEMYNFLKKYIEENRTNIRFYLEIGPGHGIFLDMAMEYIDNNKTTVCAVDISAVSMEITKSIIQYFRPQVTNVEYIVTDILDMQGSRQFDFITMGEVLEHVNYPLQVLRKVKELLNKDGKAFVSTCVNAPAIDHVYQFSNADEIREMFSEAGLIIEKELVLPVENLPMDEIVNKKIAINYCAILKEG